MPPRGGNARHDRRHAALARPDRSRRLALVAVFAGVCLAVGFGAPRSASASGTFVPPPIPQSFKDMPIEEKIKIGEALFYGRPTAYAEPLPGKPCAECHTGKMRLRRHRLIELRDRLEEVIREEHVLRYGTPGSVDTVKALFYYVHTRWRLER